MFGLCMPRGETYLKLANGELKSIMMSDESNPKKHIFEDEYVLKAIKHIGYKNVEAIIYQPDYRNNNRKTVVSIAEYYYERGQELESD